MKTLLLPLCILLLTASCSKREFAGPISNDSGPVISGGSGPQSGSSLRRSGDTLTIVNLLPQEHGPLPNWKEPLIRP